MNYLKTTGRERTIHEILDHHLQAFAEGVDSIASDYCDDSVILLPRKRIQGLGAIRSFFAEFLRSIDPDFWSSFRILHQSVDGEIAYLVWEARPFVAMATDTLLIRDNKIIVQTFTSLSGEDTTV